jgi:cytochrome bd-type quinol oxidase subunit 1
MLGPLILSVGLLLLIIYFALSKKSSRGVKNVAIVALIIVALSVLVSVVIMFIFRQPVAVIGNEPIREVIEEEVMVVKDNSFMMLIVAVFFLLLLGVIVYFALKEQKRAKLETKKLVDDLPVISDEED